jgi:beta-glucosidase/6-phospho-beta-glucosidase/beta-galactosidase
MNTFRPSIFRSFWMGGFESACHVTSAGARLDMLRATQHDRFVREDYAALLSQRIGTVRDTVRWHLVETAPGGYDFSSFAPYVDAANATGTEVIWDLLHYGWPDGLDIFSTAFVDRFARFARETIGRLSEYDPAPLVCPVNEISFFSWAGGEGGIFNPFASHRGDDMKRNLVRASVAAVDAMRALNPAIRIVQIDPIINVLPAGPSEADIRNAEAYRLSQFHAWDMLLGRVEPELGGREDCIDVIGVNYYIHNQFIWQGPMIVPSDPRYRHVAVMLQEVYERYRRPLFVAETGIEDETRPAWLRYMSKEVLTALEAGVPVEGICLYPILNHPGWDDDRHCHNGMFDYADAEGRRAVYQPLADEVARQTANFEAFARDKRRVADFEDLDTTALDWAAHLMQELTDEGRT